MHLFLDLLLVDLGLLLLLLLQLFVSGRDDLTNFEPDSADLDDIALHEPMALDVLSSIISMPHHFPEHALRVLKEVFLLDVIERVWFLSCCFQLPKLGVFGHLECTIGPTVAVLVVDPPVLASTLCNPCDEMILALLRENYRQLTPQDIRRDRCLVRYFQDVFQIVIEESMRFLGPCIAIGGDSK